MVETIISVRTEVEMESSAKNVLWKCFEKGGDKKNFLENELPEGFSYSVNRFKLIRESDIPHESKFESAFLVNICTEETANQFVKELESLTGTNFNLKKGSRKSALKNWQQKSQETSEV